MKTAIAIGSTLLLGGTLALGAAGGAGGAVSANARDLAAELTTAHDAGKLTFLERRYYNQILQTANGSTAAGCGLDVRVLQIIVIATRTFDHVGVSDLNRRCTGVLVGAGTASAHYIDGGGHAVDFYAFNHRATTGGDSNALRLITALDQIVPPGARVGQVQCRARVHTANLTQFPDTCNHLHVDVAWAQGPLRIGGTV